MTLDAAGQPSPVLPMEAPVAPTELLRRLILHNNDNTPLTPAKVHARTAPAVLPPQLSSTYRPGPLALIFRFYARVHSPVKHLTSNDLMFSDISRCNSTLSFAKLRVLLQDFDVLPGMMSVAELRVVWQPPRPRHLRDRYQQAQCDREKRNGTTPKGRHAGMRTNTGSATARSTLGNSFASRQYKQRRRQHSARQQQGVRSTLEPHIDPRTDGMCGTWGQSGGDGGGSGRELSFSGFVECLCRIAMLVYRKPGFAPCAAAITPNTADIDDAVRVRAFVEHMGVTAGAPAICRALDGRGRVSVGILNAKAASNTKSELLRRRRQRRSARSAAVSTSSTTSAAIRAAESMTSRLAAHIAAEPVGDHLLALWAPYATEVSVAAAAAGAVSNAGPGTCTSAEDQAVASAALRAHRMAELRRCRAGAQRAATLGQPR